MDETNVSASVPASRAWRLLRLAAHALLGLAGLVVVLIAAGVFDPRPSGPLVHTDKPGTLTLPDTGTTTIPQSAPWLAPPDRFSVRLQAAYVDGQTDIGYGLGLGDEAGRLVVAVSPAGFVSIWEERGGEIINHLPWQPWPHARNGRVENEVWLDVAANGDISQVTACVNREHLWQGEIGGLSPQVALWLGSFDGPATVDFRALEWFATP